MVEHTYVRKVVACVSFSALLCCVLYRLDDQVLSVNGRSLQGCTHGTAVQALKDAGSTVTLVVRHYAETPVTHPEVHSSPVQRYVNIKLEKLPGGGAYTHAMLVCMFVYSSTVHYAACHRFLSGSPTVLDYNIVM